MLTTAQAAARLGITDSQVRRLIIQGKLKARKPSPRVILVNEASVARYLETRRLGRPRKA